MEDTVVTQVQMSLNAVHAVRATQTPGVFRLDVNITDKNGETYDCEYVSYPTDPFGLAPTIRQWLVDNEGSYTVLPYTPPSIEDRRNEMLPLSARQLRIGLVNAGISLAQVESTIAAMPAGMDRDKAQIEWEFATEFNRNHPLLLSVGAALGLTPEQIDTMWLASANL